MRRCSRACNCQLQELPKFSPDNQSNMPKVCGLYPANTVAFVFVGKSSFLRLLLSRTRVFLLYWMSHSHQQSHRERFCDCYEQESHVFPYRLVEWNWVNFSLKPALSWNKQGCPFCDQNWQGINQKTEGLQLTYFRLPWNKWLTQTGTTQRFHLWGNCVDFQWSKCSQKVWLWTYFCSE